MQEMSTIRRKYEQSEKSQQEIKQERDKLRQELHDAQEALAKAREEGSEAKVIIADIEPDREIDDLRVSALQEDNDRLRRLLAEAEKKNKSYVLPLTCVTSYCDAA